MGRILRMLTGGLLYFCLATIIAEAILAVYLANTWHLDRRKLIEMLAVAQDIDLAGKHPRPAAADGQAGGEQLSFDQIIEARALKSRNLEIREQALKNDLEQFRVERGKLVDEKSSFQKSKEAFEAQLTTVKKREIDSGWDDNRRTLMTAKPKQAKELILQMFEKNEVDDVVALLRPMSDARRAKIVAEFKTPEDIKKIDQVLRLIRRGEPIATAAADVQQQMGAPVPPGTQGGP
jgi:hypothetical protein